VIHVIELGTAFVVPTFGAARYFRFQDSIQRSGSAQ